MSVRAKVVSVVAITLVTILGVEYAGSAASRHAARPPIRNFAHVYTTTDSGGDGTVIYQLPVPKPGVYQESLTANFFPNGSPSAPAALSCFIWGDGHLIAETSASDDYVSGGYVGLDGVGTFKESNGIAGVVECQMTDGSDWTWGSMPLTVTVTRLDGIGSSSISASTHAGTLHRIPGQPSGTVR